MKSKGSVTIYLSIIMVSVILFVSVLSESARIQSVQTQSEEFTYMAADSIMAGYAKQVYKDYGILLVWEDQSVEEQLKTYIQANINMADLSLSGTNLMNTSLISVEVDKKGSLTNEGENNFEKQIISYTKYAEALKAVDKLVQDYKLYEKSEESKVNKNMNVTHIVESAADELKDMADNIDKEIAKLKNTNKLEEKISAASQKLENLKGSIGENSNNGDTNAKVVNKFSKKYRNLLKMIDKEAVVVNNTIILIKQYEEKKEQFLKESGYTSGDEGYIEEDLKILENVKNTIEEIKKLTVSTFSNADSKNISLAENVLDKTKNITYDLQSLKVYEITEHDKKNEKIFENAKAFLENGILSLVIDDISQVSDLSISDSNLPTILKKKGDETSFLKDIKNRAAVSLYAKLKFGNYIEPKKDTALKYEMEYIVAGKNSDKENLKKVVEKMVVIRNVFNATYLISDGEKTKEIAVIASSAAAAMGMPFLEPVFKAIIIEAWALAEAVSDIKCLMDGGKVPLKKAASNWKTSVSNLNKTEINSHKEDGMDYQNYLQILIMLEKDNNSVYRIMDLIQVNVQNRYNSDFLISKCFYGMEIKAEFETRQLFTAIPLVVTMLNKSEGSYKYNIRCVKEY